MLDSSRRDFLWKSAAGAVTARTLQGQTTRRILIEAESGAGFRRKLAEREMLRSLARLGLPNEVRLTDAASTASAPDLLIALRVEPAQFRNPEAYSISSMAPHQVLVAGASETALLYAVYEFLERQGAFFGIDGDGYPLDPPQALIVPAAGQPWTSSPRFAVRGLLPWPDFLNCISVYNEEDFRAYFESMLRMRFNTFGMHVYAGKNQWAESYLSFEFGGAGQLAFLDNSASHRWGYLPQRTSRYHMGASQFYDSEVFGSDATRLAKDPWEAAERTQRLLRISLQYAKRLGIRTGIGFEPYQIPDEIWRALPPEAKFAENPDPRSTNPRFDIESVAARKLLDTRLGQLLEAYPEVDYVWLWEDEQMNWESRRTGIPLSVTPFRQAYDFLKRNAAEKRLVLGGWGGVARHFEHFHEKLPMDVIFSCLSDSLGWEPVHEVFGKLEGRERWPIPWLEDDPAMWLPQLHVQRFERDLNLAEQYGCQGVLGIHWRHRIVDPTAGFQARFSWDKHLTPAAYYRAYARVQAVGDRAERLAGILTDADENGRLLATGTKEIQNGHIVQHEFSGDYDEAFTFWKPYEPDPGVVDSQKEVATALRGLADAARTPTERERLEYLTRHVEFLVPYTDAWIRAHRLQRVLDGAAALKASGKAGEARQLIVNEAVPMWLELAPRVREAILDFQSIVSTRSDLGTLASMQNKFVRLALIRLRLSLQEYLGELPAQTESLFSELIRPDPKAPVRLFVPTRPSMLGKGESTRIIIVVTGEAPVRSVLLHTRAWGDTQWMTEAAKLLGRRTYQVALGPFNSTAPLVEYFVSAEIGSGHLVSPPDGDRKPHVLTMV
jgi:hypothetical protein